MAKNTDMIRRGVLRKIAPKIYTTNMEDESSEIVRRHLFYILGQLYPNVIRYRDKDTEDYNVTPNFFVRPKVEKGGLDFDTPSFSVSDNQSKKITILTYDDFSEVDIKFSLQNLTGTRLSALYAPNDVTIINTATVLDNPLPLRDLINTYIGNVNRANALIPRKQ